MLYANVSTDSVPLTLIDGQELNDSLVLDASFRRKDCMSSALQPSVSLSVIWFPVVTASYAGKERGACSAGCATAGAPLLFWQPVSKVCNLQSVQAHLIPESARQSSSIHRPAKRILEPCSAA